MHRERERERERERGRKRENITRNATNSINISEELAETERTKDGNICVLLHRT